jgi:hypothetical protein
MTAGSASGLLASAWPADRASLAGGLLVGLLAAWLLACAHWTDRPCIRDTDVAVCPAEPERAVTGLLAVQAEASGGVCVWQLNERLLALGLYTPAQVCAAIHARRRWALGGHLQAMERLLNTGVPAHSRLDAWNPFRRRAWTIPDAVAPATHERFAMLGPLGPRCAAPLEEYGVGLDVKRVCGLSQMARSAVVAGEAAQAAETKAAETKGKTMAAGAAPGACVVLSVGSFNEYSFELDVARRTACRIVTLDCTVEPVVPAELVGRLEFLRKCLGPESKVEGGLDFISWPDLVARLGVGRFAHVKMDIEGYEWPVVTAMVQTLRAEQLPEQLSLELHYQAGTNAALGWGRRMRSAGELALLVEMLVWGGGYLVVDRNDNPVCPRCTEILLARLFHPAP